MGNTTVSPTVREGFENLEELEMANPLEITPALLASIGGFPSITAYRVQWKQLTTALPELNDRNRPMTPAALADLNAMFFRRVALAARLRARSPRTWKALFDSTAPGAKGLAVLYKQPNLGKAFAAEFTARPDLAALRLYNMLWLDVGPSLRKALAGLPPEALQHPVIAWVARYDAAREKVVTPVVASPPSSAEAPVTLLDRASRHEDTASSTLPELIAAFEDSRAKALAELAGVTLESWIEAAPSVMSSLDSLSALAAQARAMGIHALVVEIEDALSALRDKLVQLEQEGYDGIDRSRAPERCPDLGADERRAYLDLVAAASTQCATALSAFSASKAALAALQGARGAERVIASRVLTERSEMAHQAAEDVRTALDQLHAAGGALASDAPPVESDYQPAELATGTPAPTSGQPDQEPANITLPTGSAAGSISEPQPGPLRGVSTEALTRWAATEKNKPDDLECPVAAPDARAVMPQADEPPGGAGRSNAEARALQHIHHLLELGCPGLALALARAFNDDTGSPLPGAPALYALLSAALVQVRFVPASQQPLDAHLSEAMPHLSGEDTPPARALCLATLAAAIRPALFEVDPGIALTAVRALVTSHQVSPVIRALADLLSKRQPRGLYDLRPELLSKGYQASASSRRVVLEQYRRQAKEIIEEKSSRFIRNFHNLPAALSQYRTYLSADHVFGVALRALVAAEEFVTATAPIKAALREFQQDKDSLIQEGYKAAGGPTRLISTHYERMSSFLDELHDFFLAAERDLAWTAESRDIARAAEYAAELDSHLAEAIIESESGSDDLLLQLAKTVLATALSSLRRLIATGQTPVTIAPYDDVLNSELALLDRDLGSDVDGAARSGYALGREVAFVTPADDVRVAIELLEPPGAESASPYLSAAEAHMAKRRLLTARRALAGAVQAGAEPAAVAEAEQKLTAMIDAGRAELRREVVTMRTQVDSAAAMSVIDDELKGQFDAILERIDRRVGQLPYAGPIENPAAADDPTDIQPALNHIRLNVATALTERVHRGCDELLREIDRDRSQLPPELAQEVERVRTLVEARSLPLAKEFWALLKSGQPLPQDPVANEALTEFNLRVLPLLKEAQRHGPIVNETLAALTTDAERAWIPATLDADARKSADAMLEDWISLLGKRGNTAAAATAKELGAFLHEHLAWSDITVTPAGQLAHAFRVDGANLALIAGSEVFTLPSLGSERKQSYTVLLLPAQSGMSTLLNLLEKADIVFYRGALQAEQRAEIHQHVRRAHRGAVIVDDLLATYMALGRKRVARMLGVGSSFVHATPYRDAQDMPREMFFGRHRVRQQILDAKQGVLVYGGRRLGKSSVLRDICERETDPKRNRFYVRVDMYNVTAEEYRREVWSRMARALIDHSVLPRSTNTAWPPEKIAREIAEAIGKRQLEVTVFIDEADSMMRHESLATPRFPVLTELNQMRSTTQGRFRFAVAGLNNAERLARYANSLLDQFADPVPLTPFVDDERRSGLDLVVKPLGALGFEFEAPDMPYEILSRALFFPALIQVFCERLLKVLYDSPHVGIPPYKITRAHMNAVDRDGALSREMLKIFKGTLELDPRYRILAFTLAYEQMQSSGTTAVSLSPARLAEKTCEYAGHLFPRGAHHTVVEALADELVNLGIFIRTNEGREFALRSTSLLSRLGTKAEIETALIEADKTPLERDEGERRVAYRHNGHLCPLPLRTIAEWGYPVPGASPVRIVAASPATGLAELELLAHDTSWIDGRAAVSAYRSGSGPARQFVDQLVRAPEKIGRVTLTGAVQCSRSIFVIPPGWPTNLPGLLQQRAAEISSVQRVIVLLANPEQVRQLAELPELPVPITGTGHWGEDAARMYAERQDLAGLISYASISETLTVTGGAPTLVTACLQKIVAGQPAATWRDALGAAGVGITPTEVLRFFGVANEHAAFVQSLVVSNLTVDEFTKRCAAQLPTTNPAVLLQCLVALGAVVPVSGTAYVTHPLIDEAILAAQ